MIIGVLLMTVATTVVAQSHGVVPVLESGAMPLYPSLARKGGIEGDVQLRVVTNGSGVVSAKAEAGNPILAKVAQDNVRSWKFAKHEPTSFHYKILVSSHQGRKLRSGQA
jgi:outer membrane biosynthesis protein TonB